MIKKVKAVPLAVLKPLLVFFADASVAAKSAVLVIGVIFCGIASLGYVAREYMVEAISHCQEEMTALRQQVLAHEIKQSRQVVEWEGKLRVVEMELQACMRARLDMMKERAELEKLRQAK